MLITADNPLDTTPTVTGKNVSPENDQNITEKAPKRKKNWWAFLSENRNQVYPNTKSSVEEDPAISPATHDPKELAAINSKITTIEQNLSQLVDRVTKLETRIKLAEETDISKITNIEPNFSNLEEIDQKINDKVLEVVYQEINNRVTMLETRMNAAEETAKITTN